MCPLVLFIGPQRFNTVNMQFVGATWFPISVTGKALNTRLALFCLGLVYQ